MSKLYPYNCKQCEAVCCYDGVYLSQKEESKIYDLIKTYPDYFKGMPELNNCIVDGSIAYEKWSGSPKPNNCIVDGKWQYGVKKTNVIPYNYSYPDFPDHFNKTRCVFVDENHFCRLESLARKLKLHKWTFKPIACWLFPLKINEKGILIPPPILAKDDPDKRKNYLGYVSYVPCQKHREDSENWQVIFEEEIEYYKKIKNKEIL